jgi:aconitate hydratase
MLGHRFVPADSDVIGVNVVGELRRRDVDRHGGALRDRDAAPGQGSRKFVEFFFFFSAKLTVPDRATIANMAPEYGATIGFFPVDAQTCAYMRQTGRTEAQVAAMEKYYRAQACFGSPRLGEIDYSQVLTLDLASITSNVAGPKRPQDRVALTELKSSFAEALRKPAVEGGSVPRRPEGAGNADVARPLTATS